jgi:hypothetical protein
VILFIIFSLFFWPGPGGTAVVQIGTTTKLIEFDVAVLGLNDLHPQANFKVGEKAKLTIQNQPSGEVTIQSVKVLPRTVSVTQPDGSVKALLDPRPEMAYSSNLLLTLKSNGRSTGDSFTIGKSKIKVGTSVRLEGQTYSFQTGVTDLRVKG